MHDPLIAGDDDIEILDLLMIPELHIHIGLVNRIVRIINDKWGDNEFYKWCDLKNIHSLKYW